MSTHTREARRLEVLAALIAIATGALGAPGATGAFVLSAALHVVLTLAAIARPAAIPAQVIAGQALAAGLLLRPDAPIIRVICVVAGVIAVAELLAAAAHARRAALPDPRAPYLRATTAALIGGGAFAAVALISQVGAPGGLLAVFVGAGACVFLACAFIALDRTREFSDIPAPRP